MILLTYEDKQRNKELRHKIIDEIMRIYDTKSLEVVHKFSSLYERQEATDHVLNLDEAIGLMDVDDIRILHKLFRGGAENLVVNRQITEICEDVIKQYEDWEGEEIDKKGTGETERAAEGN